MFNTDRIDSDDMNRTCYDDNSFDEESYNLLENRDIQAVIETIYCDYDPSDTYKLINIQLVGDFIGNDEVFDDDVEVVNEDDSYISYYDFEQYLFDYYCDDDEDAYYDNNHQNDELDEEDNDDEENIDDEDYSLIYEEFDEDNMSYARAKDSGWYYEDD
jgi:hypothetical protein